VLSIYIYTCIASKNHNFPLYVTHSYGHGGFGFQSSWGSAEFTVALMEKGLTKKKSKL
jgi:D-amino-acid oxidase